MASLVMLTLLLSFHLAMTAINTDTWQRIFLFVTLFTIFPTTAIVSGRRRREAAGSTLAEERSAVLGNYLAAREWGGAAALQRDMAAQYLQGAAGGQEQAIPGCLEQLACTYLDPTLTMEDQEREVAAM